MHAHALSHTHVHTCTQHNSSAKHIISCFFVFFCFCFFLLSPLPSILTIFCQSRGKRLTAADEPEQGGERREWDNWASQDGGGRLGGRTTVSVFLGWQRQMDTESLEQSWLGGWSQEVQFRGSLQRADWFFWVFNSFLFYFVTIIIIFYYSLLQGGGGKLLDTPLGQEGALDRLELRSRLGVLQGRVGGCHCTLGTNSSMVNTAQVTKTKWWENPSFLEQIWSALQGPMTLLIFNNDWSSYIGECYCFAIQQESF